MITVAMFRAKFQCYVLITVTTVVFIIHKVNKAKTNIFHYCLRKIHYVAILIGPTVNHQNWLIWIWRWLIWIWHRLIWIWHRLIWIWHRLIWIWNRLIWISHILIWIWHRLIWICFSYIWIWHRLIWTWVELIWR